MSDLLNAFSLHSSEALRDAFHEVGVVGFGGRACSEKLEREEPALGQQISSVWYLKQVHGTEIVKKPEGIEEITSFLNEYPIEADGWFLSIERWRGRRIGFSIRTADCLPIILKGREWIALVHAGWRGLHAGILSKAFALFQEEGDTLQSVAIGPAADPERYEVGEEFLELFPESGAVRVKEACAYFDLAHEAVFQLKQLGYDGPVLQLGVHTMSSPDFHSHRREPENGGRNFALVLFSAN